LTDSLSWFSRCTVSLQHVLPQHILTRLANRISQSRSPWLANTLKRAFCKRYPVKLEESAQTLDQFENFNAFFTRALKPGLRPLPEDSGILVSPCDGTLSQLGAIEHGRMIQAKGHTFSAAELIGNAELAEGFESGHFATIYLAPYDYHRVHMPYAGQLTHEIRVPGRLFSVSNATSQLIPGLYARNERMVALFETDRGPMAVVMVAAMLVAGIETVWASDGPYRPSHSINTLPFQEPLQLATGDELGRFHWGSTVIILTGPEFEDWNSALSSGQMMRLGRAMT